MQTIREAMSPGSHFEQHGPAGWYRSWLSAVVAECEALEAEGRLPAPTRPIVTDAERREVLAAAVSRAGQAA